MKTLFHTTIAITLVTLIAACSQIAERGPVNKQGLTTLNHSTFDQLAIRSGTDFSQYRQLKIEPVTVSYDDSRRYDSLNRKKSVFEFDERELALFNQQFSKGLSAAWGERFGWKLSEEAGADVIILKATVTDLYLYAAIKNDEILPHKAATHESSRMVIKLDLIDGESGELLLQSSGKKTTGLTGSGVNTMTRVSSVRYWSDAFQAFRQWGHLLATQIEDMTSS
ncbi:MAG: DUF3313 domain-containing protein [Oceanicoccus sp.]|uniref:DUF3313 family protein n=1 Tax=Oceanicoccus sp. TaxID=2691044 RepID=UPI00262441B3|nr:DUF3313 family protein [Oceanicoccus sp.]MCP3907096.1 DUF3313 domain-containing protein [Oceanicoccus sp.]MDG1772889.1 DUF3313 family protein [Oceanicoccus sp.]